METNAFIRFNYRTLSIRVWVTEEKLPLQQSVIFVMNDDIMEATSWSILFQSPFPFRHILASAKIMSR